MYIKAAIQILQRPKHCAYTQKKACKLVFYVGMMNDDRGSCGFLSMLVLYIYAIILTDTHPHSINIYTYILSCVFMTQSWGVLVRVVCLCACRVYGFEQDITT